MLLLVTSTEDVLMSGLRQVTGAIAVATALMALSGCGVQEDRTLQWSADGSAVAFQHGDDGIYVADGEKLEKIFTIDDTVLCSSAPLWSPDGKQVVFATARDAAMPGGQRSSRAGALDWNDHPEGRFFAAGPVVYTCWLRENPLDGQPAEPVPLFEASCDHVGYVAANLALRWHPSGESIVFLQHAEAGRHRVVQFDISTQTTQQVFPYQADAILFDWTPDGTHLVCVVGNRTAEPDRDGVWIGGADESDWWHVPAGDGVSAADAGGLIERLRAARPVWTQDGERFAQVVAERSPAGGQVLRRGCLAKRTIETWLESEHGLSDLHWEPAGERLGVLVGGEQPSLLLLTKEDPCAVPVGSLSLRRFAGWDASGRHMAYIAADPVSRSGPQEWAFLLAADPRARDTVYVAGGESGQHQRAVFGDMQITFPRWSPTEEKLSLWATFRPRYRSLISIFFDRGLRPGDPAAVVDTRTGDVRWMAVNRFEKVQIGHYYLLQHNYEEALRWYEEAAEGQAAVVPAAGEEFAERLAGRRNFALFHAYCLSKLGRDPEAQTRLAEFHDHFFPEWDAADATWDGRQAEAAPGADSVLHWAEPGSIVGELLKSFYMIEVFLSLDAAGDGCDWLQQQLPASQRDAVRLANAIALSQLLLVEERRAEYLELIGDTVLPLLAACADPMDARIFESRDSAAAAELVVWSAAILMLAPVCHQEFYQEIAAERLLPMIATWEAAGQQESSELEKLFFDVLLAAGFERLGRQADATLVVERIRANSFRLPLLPDRGFRDLRDDIREFAHELRQAATP